MRDDLIVCGKCGHTGYWDEGFFVELKDHDWAVLVCNNCGAELDFDPLCYLDIPAIIKDKKDWR